MSLLFPCSTMAVRFLFTFILFFTMAIANTEPESQDLLGNFFGENGGINSVYDWMFGDEDEEHMAHHFGYLGQDEKHENLGELIQKSGLKPEFLNFKAHDFDGNDKIDGLEMYSLINNEKHFEWQNSLLNAEQRDNLIAQIIDRVFQAEDVNHDGYLDFVEYSNTRRRLETRA